MDLTDIVDSFRSFASDRLDEAGLPYSCFTRLAVLEIKKDPLNQEGLVLATEEELRESKRRKIGLWVELYTAKNAVNPVVPYPVVKAACDAQAYLAVEFLEIIDFDFDIFPKAWSGDGVSEHIPAEATYFSLPQ